MSNMKLIIAGGRDFADAELLSKEVSLFLPQQAPDRYESEIVSGLAPGADQIGKTWAHNNGFFVVRFPAKWEDLTAVPCLIKTRKDGSKYNALAGLNRNTEMADYATHLIAFWDGKSDGTRDMIKKATERGLIVKIVEY